MREVMSRVAREFGDSLRTTRARRVRLRRRATAIGLLACMVGATIIMPPRPWLLWNASASAPIGLYRITAPHDMVAGDMVIARVPARWRALAAERRYVPANVPLVKRVVAAPGDNVCAWGWAIFVNGRWAATRSFVDAHGRAMPRWNGCTLLRDGAVFLLMDDAASFDGRYFGPTDRGDIVGRARLLWAR